MQIPILCLFSTLLVSAAKNGENLHHKARSRTKLAEIRRPADRYYRWTFNPVSNSCRNKFVSVLLCMDVSVVWIGIVQSSNL
jgi:hypothetical protein